MTADKVRDDLLAEAGLPVNTIENVFKLPELPERGFTHQLKHTIRRVLRSNLQPAAYMTRNQFTGVFGIHLVDTLVFCIMQKQVVTHPAADIAPLDARQSVYGMVNVQQSRVVGIQVRAYFRMDARRTLAPLARLQVFPLHAVHVGRRAAQVGKITLEIGHFRDLPDFFENTFLAAVDDELALMGGNGAERTSSETSPMQVHRKLDHLVRRDAFSLVFGMGQPGVEQVERMVDFILRHRRIGRIDHYIPPAGGLDDTLRVVFVAFFLDMPEIFGLRLHVFQTVLMGVQDEVAGNDSAGNILLIIYRYRLGNAMPMCNHIAEGLHAYAGRTVLRVIQMGVSVLYGHLQVV